MGYLARLTTLTNMALFPGPTQFFIICSTEKLWVIHSITIVLFSCTQITFKTRIYHPNIDEKGQVCLPIISPENWKPATKTDQGSYEYSV